MLEVAFPPINEPKQKSKHKNILSISLPVPLMILMLIAQHFTLRLEESDFSVLSSYRKTFTDRQSQRDLGSWSGRRRCVR